MQNEHDSLERVWGGMDTVYQQWQPHFRELSRSFDPGRQRFEKDTENQKWHYNRTMIDPKPTLAARTLSYGMMAGVTNPSTPWIKLQTEDEDLNKFHSVRLWLDDVSKRILNQLARSNFYNVMPSMYSDLGIYSTGNVTMAEDTKTVIRFEQRPMGSYRIANSERLDTNQWAAEYKFSAQQLVNKFGKENCSSPVQSAFDAKDFKSMFPIRHLIAPRSNFNPERMDPKNMPFMSIYWEPGSSEGKILRESGFRTFPSISPRWEVVGNDSYGSFAPGMIALGTARGLQKDHKTRYEAQDKMVNPPLNVPASLRNNRATLVPGGVNYIPDNNMGAKIEPVYNVNYPVGDVLNSIADSRNILDQSFFADLFLLITNINRSGVTATEIAERQEEKLLMLGPVMNRLNEEGLDPVVERMFDEMTRRGMLPPPPPELEGISIQIEYISMMAQAQKLVGIGSIERSVSFIGNLAGAKPEVLDKINADAVVDEYIRITGANPIIINSDDTVAVIRKQRADDIQTKQLAESAQPMQQAAGAAKLLSETDTGGQSALQLMQANLGGL